MLGLLAEIYQQMPESADPAQVSHFVTKLI
jgi:hypothetical protein